MATTPIKVWTRLLGESSYQDISVITIGLDGSIYVAGQTEGSVDGQIYAGNGDSFLTKYTPDGTKAWTRLLGTNQTDAGHALTTGLDGAIYVSGYTSGSLDGQANNGINDAFLTKYSPDGIKAWTQLLGTSKVDHSYALTTGLDGAIYVGGFTSGSLDGQNYSGIEDAFLTKYSPDGIDLPPPCRTKVMEQSPLISENSGYETIQIYR